MLNIFVSKIQISTVNLHQYAADAKQDNGNRWEYLLAAHPNDETCREIIVEKILFSNDYLQEVSIRTKPQIVIASFLAKEALEGTLVRWMQNICKLQTSFTVCFNNFSGFPPHTIYLRILDPRPLIQLALGLKIIDGFVQSNDCPPIHLRTKPHLAIAENLPEHIYTEAVKEYAQKTFHASFHVKKLMLVKRSWEGGSYELVNTFYLPPDPGFSD
jgi:hypothetical protein